jgi:hypothetical protein
MKTSLPRTRKLTIIAQDPAVTDSEGRILTTSVEIPAEELSPGPRGYRVHVVDYDTSTNTFYVPQEYPEIEDNCYYDPFEDFVKTATKQEILDEPGFHAQNVYAIVMRTLARFEFALGRRVGWGFSGHQIYVAPHAFADANAFYSEADQSLAFGYFNIPGDSRPVFTCLSHDVVAHETTHAILDGLRERYTAPSSPEQAGFHEGFADLVAILSVFSLKDVVKTILLGKAKSIIKSNRIPVGHITEKALKNSVLFGLADEMGSKLTGIRGNALRKSAEMKTLAEAKQRSYLGTTEFYEPHKCGELLVAIMLNVFLRVWLRRLEKYMEDRDAVDVAVIVDEGAESANHLLTMSIRALDYLPPTDMRFSDYLSALLTSDSEVVPDDSKYEYRQKLRDSFEDYGVEPPPKANDEGYWNIVEGDYIYDRTHFDSLMRDPNEIFRFIWDNRVKLRVEPEDDFSGKVYTKVQSVRPCIRIGPDGFTVRETVAEYVQMSVLRFDELDPLGLTNNIRVVIPPDTEISLYGGGTLIFDEFGQLKYHIRNNIFSRSNQPRRIEYLWRYGYLSNTAFTENVFSRMHMNRILSSRFDRTEGFE